MPEVPPAGQVEGDGDTEQVHGQDRASVQKKVSALGRAAGIHALPHCVLFSSRRFKQRGARYAQPALQSKVSADG